MKSTSLALAGLLFATVISAHAQRIKWDYIELEYDYVDFDDEELNTADGVGISIYNNPVGQVFFSGNFEYLRAETFFDEADLDLFSAGAGIGHYWPLQDNLQLVAEVNGSYSWGDGFGEFGVAVGPGVRWGVTDRVELYTSAYYNYSEDGTSAFDVAAGTIITIAERFALIGGYIYGDGDNTFYGGIQVQF